MIHNYIFRKTNIESEYRLYELEEGENILKTMKEREIEGFNITVPYKEVVMKQLDFISPEAQRIGAVNLVQIKDGKSYGYNSDYFGIMRMFENIESI